MTRPPSVPRAQHLNAEPTWQTILAGYVIAVAVPTALWVLSHPVTGTLAFGAVAGLLVGARRGHRLVRCFYDCGRMAFDVAGRARVTVQQKPVDDCC